MRTERRVVDNRVFLLGLDKLYRDAMRPHERGELLSCARRVAGALDVPPADVPIEGYYTEHPQLTEYFRLMRALQNVDESRTAEVAVLPEFVRLLKVASAPLFGRPAQGDKLLPAGRDALSEALIGTRPDWSVERLTATAYTAALATDDISLVGLAARIRDPVVLTAVRESVVLHAEVMCTGLPTPTQYEYIWEVDDDLAAQASRFIDAFHALFGEKLPPPDPTRAETYWHACSDNEVACRCVRLGHDPAGLQYHWAIFPAAGLHVQEFWHDDIWTTERYRAAFHSAQTPYL